MSANLELVTLAKDLLSKAELFADPSALSKANAFLIREQIRSRAQQIANAIDGPRQSMKAITRSYTTCSALKICMDLGIAQQIPQIGGCSTEELVGSTSCNKQILRPVLRLLVQNGIFQQGQDGKWRHTDMSRTMLEPPFKAWMRQLLEEKYQSVAHLPHLLKQTRYAAPELGKTAFNAVYSTPLDFYTYSAKHDHDPAVNFALSMEELARTQLPFLERSYPLDKLAPDSHFVDVAGGFGYLSIFLAEKLPKATFEVQDYPYIVEEASSVCPDSARDRITFRAQDMLQPQPSRADRGRPVDHGKLIFLLKIILHDHVDAECQLILRHLVAAMELSDKILIIDTVIPEIGGSLSSSNADLIQLSMFGSGHRTLKEFQDLIHSCDDNLSIKTFTGGVEEFEGMMVIEIQKLAIE